MRKIEKRIELALEELEQDATFYEMESDMEVYDEKDPFEEGRASGIREAIRKIELVMKNIDYPKIY